MPRQSALLLSHRRPNSRVAIGVGIGWGWTVGSAAGVAVRVGVGNGLGVGVRVASTLTAGRYTPYGSVAGGNIALVNGVGEISRTGVSGTSGGVTSPAWAMPSRENAKANINKICLTTFVIYTTLYSMPPPR